MATDKSRIFTELIEVHLKEMNIVEIYHNKSIDFKAKDVVQCSYMKGLYEVKLITPTYLEVAPIENNSLRHFIGPNFLKKVSINQNIRKILYD
jgi:hypothetical protein